MPGERTATQTPFETTTGTPHVGSVLARAPKAPASWLRTGSVAETETLAFRFVARAVLDHINVVPYPDEPPSLLTRDALRMERDRLHATDKKLVFTNGAFDLLHVGHLRYLAFARSLGDALAVGLNSDASVRRYKGDQRPIVPERERAELLLGLRCVDFVVIFDEDEPRDLIAAVLPDVLVKGADWAHHVSGREIVEAHGGRVVLADLVPGRSTTSLVERILSGRGGKAP